MHFDRNFYCPIWRTKANEDLRKLLNMIKLKHDFRCKKGEFMAVNQDKQMLSLFVDTGRLMLQSGAEIGRADTTIKLMGQAYGAVQMDILAITNFLVVTMIMPCGNEYTITRKINSMGTDFSRIEALNSLSRSYCANPFGADELRARLSFIAAIHKSKLKDYAGTALVGLMFSGFFGASLFDALVCSVLSLIVCYASIHLARYCSSNIFYNFLCALIAGFAACIVNLFLPIHVDKVMMGLIMILIPGRALTNSIKDIFLGDTLSGIMRLTEALFCGAAIAFGFIIPVFVMGM